MKDLQQQLDAQAAKTRQAKPEFGQAVDDVMAAARKFEQGGSALTIGQQAPDFELPNAHATVSRRGDMLTSITAHELNRAILLQRLRSWIERKYDQRRSPSRIHRPPTF